MRVAGCEILPFWMNHASFPAALFPPSDTTTRPLTLALLHPFVSKSNPIQLYSPTAVCDLALSFGEGSDGDSKKRMSRPFGVALLLAGYDTLDGPQLFFSDPSGTFVRYKAKAIGAGSEGAQSNLEESYSETLTLQETEDLALSTLKEVMEEKISTDNIELARVTAEKGFHIVPPEEVAVILERL